MQCRLAFTNLLKHAIITRKEELNKQPHLSNQVICQDETRKQTTKSQLDLINSSWKRKDAADGHPSFPERENKRNTCVGSHINTSLNEINGHSVQCQPANKRFRVPLKETSVFRCWSGSCTDSRNVRILRVRFQSEEQNEKDRAGSLYVDEAFC
jgi:hypothetical protein